MIKGPEYDYLRSLSALLTFVRMADKKAEQVANYKHALVDIYRACQKDRRKINKILKGYELDTICSRKR